MLIIGAGHVGVFDDDDNVWLNCYVTFNVAGNLLIHLIHVTINDVRMLYLWILK